MAETLVLGHRGAPWVAPENTVAGVAAALAAGSDGVELDVRQTLDDALICFHDVALGRTAPGDAVIQDCRLADLQALGAGIPTLAEALVAAADAALVMLEAKMPEGDRDLLLPSISDLLGAFARDRGDRAPPLLLATKQVHVLREIHEIASAQSLAAILGRPLPEPEWRFVLGLPARTLALRGDLCTADRIADLRASGHAWIAWTINDVDEARRCRDLGAHAIVTDDVAGTVAALRA